MLEITILESLRHARGCHQEFSVETLNWFYWEEKDIKENCLLDDYKLLIKLFVICIGHGCDLSYTHTGALNVVNQLHCKAGLYKLIACFK